MKAFTSRVLTSRIVVALLLGFTALAVSFVAAAACETPGTTSTKEVTAGSIALGVYLAFCQFWIAPRGCRSVWSEWPTVLASIVPLLIFVKWIPWVHGVPCGLAAGCVGSVSGAWLAYRVTRNPTGLAAAWGAVPGGVNYRRSLLGAFCLLGVIAVMISLGVIPAVATRTFQKFNSGAISVFLGITVVLSLLLERRLAVSIWQRREKEAGSKGILGFTAFFGLLVGASYLAFGFLVGGDSDAPRIGSVLLILAGFLELFTSALMTVASVFVDRSRTPSWKAEG